MKYRITLGAERSLAMPLHRHRRSGSAMHWKSVSLATLGGAVLKHIMALAAVPATILGRTDVALRALLLARARPSPLCEEIL